MTFRAVSLIPALPLLAACEAQEPVALELPTDEVPVQQRLVSGNGRYSFKNGCVVVLEQDRAVAGYHRSHRFPGSGPGTS